MKILLIVNTIIISLFTATAAYAEPLATTNGNQTKTPPAFTTPTAPHQATPEERSVFSEFVSVGPLFMKEVTECVRKLSTLKGCDSGKNGIPKELHSTGMLESAIIVNGVITITPQAILGLTASDTYILVPTLMTDGSLTWRAEGGLVNKSYDHSESDIVEQ